MIAESDTVLVLSGDHPLISAEIIGELIAAHEEAGAGATVMTTELEDPGSYGRIVRGDDGDVERIVEAKEPGDATEEELAITEVNAGTYAFAGARRSPTRSARIGNDNAQGEYYLGDVLPLIREARPAASPPTRPPTPGSTSASTTASTSPARPRRRAAACSRPTCAAASRSSIPPRPGSTPTSSSHPT